MKIMMVAGEASGDFNGSHLARELKRRSESIQLFGMGGKLMEEAGVELLYNPMAISAVGFLEVVKSAQVLRRVLARFADELDRRRPDCIVAIDFPEFNMRLAELAKARGIPVVYFFSPSAWLWRKGRARTVAGHAASVCAVFPLEAEVYREAGAHVEYVGHPLIDTAKPSQSREEARREFGCEEADPVVTLLPGSRKQELDNHLGLMLASAKRIHAQRPKAQFLLALAHTVEEERVAAKLADGPPVKVVQGKTYDALAASDAAIAAIGTVTLEAALVGCPIVGVYRMSTSMYWIARRLYKGKYVALPNIVAKRDIVPELIQDEATPDRIAEEIIGLLAPERREAVLEGYQEVRRLLGGPGAISRTADEVLRVAQEAKDEAKGATGGR